MALYWQEYFSLFVHLFYWNINYTFNTLRPMQNGRHFADDIFKRIFLNVNIWIQIKISLKFVPKSSIRNIPALIQIMAWRRPGDKPLSEPMMANLPTHICVTRPQWVKACFYSIKFITMHSYQYNHNSKWCNGIISSLSLNRHNKTLMMLSLMLP